MKFAVTVLGLSHLGPRHGRLRAVFFLCPVCAPLHVRTYERDPVICNVDRERLLFANKNSGGLDEAIVISKSCCIWHVSLVGVVPVRSAPKRMIASTLSKGVGAAAEDAMSLLTFFPNLRVRDNSSRDDLGPARGGVA